ncbi:LPD25 domain-containing protein [Bacillus sp. Wb]
MTNSIQIPTLKIVSMVGFNDQAYENIKQAAKEEIPFRVAIRRCKRKYAYNSIDIRPHGKKYEDNGGRWTEEEFDHVLNFVVRHGLTTNTLSIYEEKSCTDYLLYAGGFNFTFNIDKAYTEDGELFDLHKHVLDAKEVTEENATIELPEMNENMERLADEYTEVVCEIGKRYNDMDEVEQLTAQNKLMKFMNELEITVSNDDLNYLKSEYPALHDVVKDLNETTKIKVESIEFVWSESAEIEDGLTVKSFKEANDIINKIARKAPENGCYDKTKFLITFEDGKTYEGRLDIENKHFMNYTLSSHIIDHCTFYTGENKPSHLTEEEYQLHVDRAEMKESYKFFLDNYQLEDGEEDETPPNPSKIEVIELSIKANEKQLETLNKRLEKEHVKPLVLYKDNRTNSIVLECLNTNLDNPSRFCFSIDESGVERGKGYAYPTDDLQVVKTYSDDTEQLETLFHHSNLTDAQNKSINRIYNKWKDSNKYSFASVYKTKGDNEQTILHIVNTEDNSDWYGRFNLTGHMVYSSSTLDQTFNPCELIHDFNKPKLRLVVNN